MKRNLIVYLLIILPFLSVYCQPFTIELWPDGKIPNYLNKNEIEHIDTGDIIKISKVQIPTIEVYLPSKRNSTGKAVLICPGGGYWVLAYDWEGTDIAKWLNSKGIAGIVLKNRLPTSISQITPHLSPLMDAQRALRIIRYNSDKWNIDSSKIGVMGFSAGGHLASSLSVHFDYGKPDLTDPIEKVSCRPDFSILIYPVISFKNTKKHTGSSIALIGEKPDTSLINYYSSELQVKHNCPPTFIVHSADDLGVPYQNSILYFEALIEKKIPAELHIFKSGGHGYGLGIKDKSLRNWPELCYDWIVGL